MNVSLLPRVLRAFETFMNTPFPDLFRRRSKIAGKDAPSLDVALGGTLISIRPALHLSWIALGLTGFVTGIFSSGGHAPWWLVVAVFGCLAAEWIASRASCDRLSVQADRLTWRRVRRRMTVREQSVELSRIRGAHSSGDRVLIELEDGSTWDVGEGLGVPRSVRRWVARSVAGLLPAP